MEIKVTGHSHNLKATLQYIYGHNNRAHKNTNGVTERNKILVGLNGVPASQGFNEVYRSMSHWNHLKPNNKVKSTQVVLSFSHDELRFEKGPEQVSRGLKIASDFAHRAFPHHSILLAPQNDNRNEISHVHLVVDEISQKDLKALSGSEYGIQRLRRLGARALSDYNRSPAYHGHQITELTKQGHHATRSESLIIKRLQPVLSDTGITSQSKFRKACKAQNVRAKFIRHRHYITSRGSDGKKHYVRLKNGKREFYIIHGLVFKAIGKNANRGYIRASNISKHVPALSYRNIHQMFKNNKALNNNRMSNLYNNSTSHPFSNTSLSLKLVKANKANSSNSSNSDNDSSDSNSITKQPNSNNNHTMIIQHRMIAIKEENNLKLKKLKKRKEKMLYDRRRISEKYNRQLTEMARSSNEEFERMDNIPGQTYRQHSSSGRQDFHTATEYGLEQERQPESTGLQKFIRRLSWFCTCSSKSLERIKQSHIRERAQQLRYRLYKKVHERIERIYQQIQKYTQRVINNIRRYRQRKAKQRRIRRNRWRFDQGGIER